jgi:hypothetical protein
LRADESALQSQAQHALQAKYQQLEQARRKLDSLQARFSQTEQKKNQAQQAAQKLHTELWQERERANKRG